MNDKLIDEIKTASSKEAKYYGVEANIDYELIKLLLAGKTYTLDKTYTMISSENNYNLAFDEVNEDSEVINKVRYEHTEYNTINFSYSEQHGNIVYAIDILPQPSSNGKMEAMISVTATNLANMEAKDHHRWPTGKTVYLNGINEPSKLVSVYNKIISMGINRFLKLSDEELKNKLGIEVKESKGKITKKAEEKPENIDDLENEEVASALAKIATIYPDMLTDKQKAFMDSHSEKKHNSSR